MFKSSMSIPDGWLDFSPYGKPIQNTRIIATKSPMRKEFGLEKAKELTPTLLVDRLHQDGYTLGHVIDLTFTDRYYSPQEFRHLGVGHQKVKVPGKEIPGDDIFAQFSVALNNFLSDKTKDGQFVAVHCTHGINRTGYLICRYLIEKNGMSAESSIRAFNQARGHEIENKEYVEKLKRIYPGKKASPPPRASASASLGGGHSPSAYCLHGTQHHGIHKKVKKHVTADIALKAYQELKLKKL
ncbi:hypothetical protein EMCRGX_G001552 [Ephydatia muelleri]|eukprot:Em0001g1427a